MKFRHTDPPTSITDSSPSVDRHRSSNAVSDVSILESQLPMTSHSRWHRAGSRTFEDDTTITSSLPHCSTLFGSYRRQVKRPSVAPGTRSLHASQSSSPRASYSLGHSSFTAPITDSPPSVDRRRSADAVSDVSILESQLHDDVTQSSTPHRK